MNILPVISASEAKHLAGEDAATTASGRPFQVAELGAQPDASGVTPGATALGGGSGAGNGGLILSLLAGSNPGIQQASVVSSGALQIDGQGDAAAMGLGKVLPDGASTVAIAASAYGRTIAAGVSQSADAVAHGGAGVPTGGSVVAPQAGLPPSETGMAGAASEPGDAITAVTGSEALAHTAPDASAQAIIAGPQDEAPGQAAPEAPEAGTTESAAPSAEALAVITAEPVIAPGDADGPAMTEGQETLSTATVEGTAIGSGTQSEPVAQAAHDEQSADPEVAEDGAPVLPAGDGQAASPAESELFDTGDADTGSGDGQTEAAASNSEIAATATNGEDVVAAAVVPSQAAAQTADPEDPDGESDDGDPEATRTNAGRRGASRTHSGAQGGQAQPAARSAAGEEHNAAPSMPATARAPTASPASARPAGHAATAFEAAAPVIGETAPPAAAIGNGVRGIIDIATQQPTGYARAGGPMPPATEQVAVHISRAVQSGSDRITVQLKPASLGMITVELEVGHNNRLIAVVSADRQDTLDLLQRDARSLERALNDAGLKTDSGSLSFNLRGDGEHRNFGRSFAAHAGDAALGDGAAGDTGQPETNIHGRGLLPGGGIDIRV